VTKEKHQDTGLFRCGARVRPAYGAGGAAAGEERISSGHRKR
ncbi:hypothetical protein AVDCRST_MAG84-3523, partial [uncultured Microcoleus sp.]